MLAASSRSSSPPSIGNRSVSGCHVPLQRVMSRFSRVRGDMDERRRREFHEALLDADGFEDLPGKWQAAIVSAEQNRPDLRVIGSDSRPDQ